jgi:molybdopterin-guanine dinucleotide biosynthesis protein A
MKLAAAILAGGRARRLGGVHKGLLVVGGEPMVARQLRLLAPFAGELLVIANDADPYAAIAAAAGARVVRDLHPGLGPLAGLEAALSATTAPALLLLACDLPFAEVAPLATAAPALAVVARAGEVVQPLCARYDRAVLPRVQARLAAQQLRFLDFVAELAPAYVEVAPRALLNVNTPDELAAADALTCS